MLIPLFLALSTSSISVSSPAFADGQPIPVKFTCKVRQQISPPLTWNEGPEGTKSYALIVDDPDAPSGTFVHWILYNLTETSLPAGAKVTSSGANGTGKAGFTPPCPPAGVVHHYRFHVFALDTTLEGLNDATTAESLRSAMSGHVLDEGETVGTFQR